MDEKLPNALGIVHLSMKEYQSLLVDSRWRLAHEVAGVDNWEGRDWINWKFVETGEGEATIV